MQGYLEQMRWCKIDLGCSYSFFFFFFLLTDCSFSYTVRSLSEILHCLQSVITTPAHKPWSCLQNECRLVLHTYELTVIQKHLEVMWTSWLVEGISWRNFAGMELKAWRGKYHLLYHIALMIMTNLRYIHRVHYICTLSLAKLFIKSR